MAKQTGSKLGKEYLKAVYHHPAYLTSMQSTSREMPVDEAQAGIKIAGKNIHNLRYADDTTLMAENKKEIKSLLMRVKKKWKSWLKTQDSKNLSFLVMASSPITSRQIDGENGNSRNSDRLYFLGSQSKCG